MSDGTRTPERPVTLAVSSTAAQNSSSSAAPQQGGRGSCVILGCKRSHRACDDTNPLLAIPRCVTAIQDTNRVYSGQKKYKRGCADSEGLHSSDDRNEWSRMFWETLRKQGCVDGAEEFRTPVMCCSHFAEDSVETTQTSKQLKRVLKYGRYPLQPHEVKERQEHRAAQERTVLKRARQLERLDAATLAKASGREERRLQREMNNTDYKATARAMTTDDIPLTQAFVPGPFYGSRERKRLSFGSESDDDTGDDEYMHEDVMHHLHREEEEKQEETPCNNKCTGGCSIGLAHVLQCTWWREQGNFGNLFFFGKPEIFNAFYDLICAFYDVTDLNDARVTHDDKVHKRRNRTSFKVCRKAPLRTDFLLS